MIYLLILLSTTQSAIDIKETRHLQIEKKQEKVIKLLRFEKYEEALSLTDEPGIKGRIKILQGKIFEGLLDIEKSALKGNVGSCTLFLLSKMGVGGNDLKAVVRSELGFDSTLTFISAYTKYLMTSPESLLVSLNDSDSLLKPFIIFRIAEKFLDEEPLKSKEYLKRLPSEYPKSIPAIIARDLIRVIEEKLETD